jgi:hypothetical protein
MDKQSAESFDLDIKYIEDFHKRRVTYSKRKRCLFKKGIELSVMCGLDVYLVVFDRCKQKLIELNSSSDFDANLVQKLTSEDTRLQFAHKRYTNKDFHDFKKVTLEDDLSEDQDEDLED